jgi:squalene-hopene/tetraprenyl-beta-curcumene cyclase
MNRITTTCLLLAATLATAALRLTPRHAAAATTPAWDRVAAARFLDAREIWWQQWPHAQKDHGTVCVSCHTQVPYALARPALSQQLGEPTLTPAERAMRASIDTRVNGWADMVPFYTDAKNGPGKTAEARATESVNNASMLAAEDARTGHLRPVTRAAFDQAWELQEQKGDNAGGWIWQNFHYGPWEGDESEYQCSALFYLEALNAPEGYAAEPDARVHLVALHGYLTRHYSAQPLLNQLYTLWAASKDPTLLTPQQRTALIAALAAAQQPDGGFRTAALDPIQRTDDTPQPLTSDGYATAIAILALQTTAPRNSPMLHRALDWLTHHQRPDGSWFAASLNKERDPKTAPYLFMTDAATAYAVLALENQR